MVKPYARGFNHMDNNNNLIRKTRLSMVKPNRGTRSVNDIHHMPPRNLCRPALEAPGAAVRTDIARGYVEGMVLKGRRKPSITKQGVNSTSM